MIYELKTVYCVWLIHPYANVDNMLWCIYEDEQNAKDRIEEFNKEPKLYNGIPYKAEILPKQMILKN